MFVLKPDLEEEQLNSLIERFSQVIATQGGTTDNVDRWGKRRLAYEVEGFREGYYVIIRFQGGPAVASELDRTFRITDDVLRNVILRADNVSQRIPEKREEPRLPEPRAAETRSLEPRAQEPKIQESKTLEPKIQETRVQEVKEPEIQEPTVKEPE
jgi:small subunit ribosomal protein S6